MYIFFIGLSMFACQVVHNKAQVIPGTYYVSFPFDFAKGQKYYSAQLCRLIEVLIIFCIFFSVFFNRSSWMPSFSCFSLKER